LLVLGVAISVFPSQETYFETTTAKTLSLPRTLASQNATSVGTLMKPEMWFQLNISSSGSVKVRVLVMQHSSNGSIKVLIWGPFTESSFNQEVSISTTGTYLVEINNENPSSVTLDGNVLVRQKETHYNIFHPYIILCLLIILGGTTTLLLGVFKKTKRHSKSKRSQKPHSATV
jgi:hypothetical protein